MKIRGVRIELGEIDHHLAAFPGVADAAAVTRQGADGETTVAAFLAGDCAAAPEHLLRAYLAERLPPQAIPSSFDWVDELPLSPNGKIDRRALAAVAPAPAATAASAGTSVAAPDAAAHDELTEDERLLADLWEPLLGERVDRRDRSFFELGGYSLLAMRFVAELERRTGVQIPPRDALVKPLAVLARSVGGRASRAADAVDVVDVPAVRSPS